MVCFLPRSTLRPGYTSLCRPWSSSFCISLGRPWLLSTPNVIRILIGCCVLNHLYQLNLSLVELCIIYFLKVGQGGRMSMSVLNPRLQLINGLPNSPKTEAKGVLLVRAPWDESSGSPGLSFNINRSQSFPGVWLG